MELRQGFRSGCEPGTLALWCPGSGRLNKRQLRPSSSLHLRGLPHTSLAGCGRALSWQPKRCTGRTGRFQPPRAATGLPYQPNVTPAGQLGPPSTPPGIAQGPILPCPSPEALSGGVSGSAELLWNLVDVGSLLGSVGGTAAFLVTKEIQLLALPAVLPLVALFASRQRERSRLEVCRETLNPKPPRGEVPAGGVGARLCQGAARLSESPVRLCRLLACRTVSRARGASPQASHQPSLGPVVSPSVQRDAPVSQARTTLLIHSADVPCGCLCLAVLEVYLGRH
jgi:hypothetical protein